MDLEAQLSKIVSLKPHFGRAEAELDAVVIRARAGDFRGVLQGSRLVVEMLLRALVVDHLKQTPGKLMLEELLQKFQQAANAGVVPTPVLTHMRTVQAWGNLGAHDHAASLSDEAVKVGHDEAATSINSLVAILSWYAERFGSAQRTAGSIPVASTTSGGAKQAAPPPAPRKRLPVPLLALVGLGLVGAVGTAAFLFNGPDGDEALRASNRSTLDALYGEAKLKPPPPACNAKDLEELQALPAVAGAVLGGKARSVDAQLTLLASRASLSGEGWYLVALAGVQLEHEPARVLERAQKAAACGPFAAAQAFAGKAALSLQKLDIADGHYANAIAADPGAAGPYFNRGLIALQQQRAGDARTHFTESLQRDSNDAMALYLRGEAALLANDEEAAIVDLEKSILLNDRLAPTYLSLGRAYAKLGKEEDAQRAFCKSSELGNASARALCNAR